MYLTYDIGTSALKVALVDSDGSISALSIQEYSPICPRPGLYEMAVEVYWNALVGGTREVISTSGASLKDLSAIGLASQGQTFVPIDASGKAMHNAIVWLDNRAQSTADCWTRDWLSVDAFRANTGYPYIPAELTVFKVAWLTEHYPEIRKAWKFLCLPDYLIYRLCGEVVTDPVTAQMTGFRDIRTGTWSPAFVGAGGIDVSQLPAVMDSGCIAGFVLPSVATEVGLPGGLPVCVGTNDQIAGSVGAGNTQPGIVTETTGTALVAATTCPTLWEEKQLVVGPHALRGSYYALAISMTAAIVLKWFRDMASPGKPYDHFLAEVEQISPGSDGLVVLPHFSGIGTPSFNPAARGAFIGLDLSHTKAHIARAIMESCACLLQECLEPMQRATEIRTVRSMGGAARSDVWLQMKADMLGIPIERPKCLDAASLGAAMLAATGIGRFGSLVEASDAWYRCAAIHEPNQSRHAEYQAVYSKYRALCSRLY